MKCNSSGLSSCGIAIMQSPLSLVIKAYAPVGILTSCHAAVVTPAAVALAAGVGRLCLQQRRHYVV